MPRPKLPPGPGRPRSDVRVPVSFRLQPEKLARLDLLADVVADGNRTRALEYAVDFSTAGLEPAAIRRTIRKTRRPTR